MNDASDGPSKSPGTNDAGARVFVVEDNPWARRGVQKLLEAAGYGVEVYGSGTEFLAREPAYEHACLVLDLNLPGFSGLDLQRELAATGHSIPIIFLTGYGDIPTSVQAMRDGAVDFLTKPVNRKALLEAVARALEQGNRARETQAEVKSIRARVESLTPREQKVFSLVAAGMLNKEVAYELGIKEKTVKVHRARVMVKMRVRSLAELVRAAMKVGIPAT